MQNPNPSFLEKLFGNIQWQAPFWLRDLRAHPRKLAGPAVMVAFVALLLGIGARSCHRLPDSDAVVAAVMAPDWSVVDEEGVHPQPLKVEFGRSALRLELADKVVESGIKLSPAVKGVWHASGDAQLVFTPEEDWPARTQYKVALDRALFADGVKLADYALKFTTLPFAVTVEDAKFYVNPKQPDSREITATLRFTHPVDEASLKNHLSLSGVPAGLFFSKTATPPLLFKLDRHNYTAYLRTTAPLERLPEKPVFANIEVAAGLSPSAGKALAKAVRQEVMIPDLYSLLKISDAQFVIVNDTGGVPRQTLMFNTGAPVSAKALREGLSVWLLPRDDYWRLGEMENGLPHGAERLDAKVNATEQDYAELHSLTLDLPPGRQVCLKIGKGLAGLGGFVLRDDFTTVLRVPSYPKELRVMHDGSVLALGGERKLSVLTRGVERVEFRLGKVAASQINHLVSQSDGSFQNPYFRNYSFGEDNVSKVWYQTVTVSGDLGAKANYLTLDFAEWLRKNGAEPRGLFFLEAAEQHEEGTPPRLADGQPDHDPSNSRWDSQRQYGNGGVTDRRFVLITDLGLIVKDNVDGTHDVFVQSVKGGAPVGGVSVSVLGKNGEPVARAETDSGGHAKLPRVRDLKREKRPVAFLAQKDGDVSFLPFDRADRRLNLSRYNIGGLELEDAKTLTVFLFTERGIYRPGDEVRFGIVAKQYDWAGNLDGIPLKLVITDAADAEVSTQTLKLNKEGFLTAEFATKDEGRTGAYRAEVYLNYKDSKRDRLLGAATFRVEEFLPDRLKIKAALNAADSQGWVSPRELSVSVNLQNLYGAPAAGHRVNGELELTPASYAFGAYPGYEFHDPDQALRTKRHQAELDDEVTDERGDATLRLNLSAFERGVYQLAWYARGFEKEGGRNVSAAGGTLVSSREFLVGVKADTDLNYLRLGSKPDVAFVAVGSDLKPRAAGPLTLSLYEKRHLSVLTKNANGNYAYQSVLKENLLGEQAVTVSEQGWHYAPPTGEPGNFVARLRDADGDCYAELEFSVVGNANLSRSLEKNAELHLKLSKPSYKTGEEIQLAITAPYAGAGLITIEQDKVRAHKWFRAATTSSVQTITLPAGLEGNAYVTVTFMRALDSAEIFTSPLSYAVAPFAINRDQRAARVTLTAPEKTRPGEPLTIGYQTDRPSKIIVYAVDEGILQVARYTLPDPLGHFLEKRALQVGTSQILDQILPEYSVAKKVAAAGGDGEDDAALAAGLNPFKRKTEAPVVFWSGIVDADSQRRELTYNVPEYFNGTLRVMAVAVRADATGSAERTLNVRGPLIIQPNVPTFVAPGDEFEVTVSVANNIEGSGANAQVAVDLTVSGGLQIVEKNTTPVIIAEGTDLSLRYKLKATRELGNATLTFSATASGESVRYAATLSVRPDSAYQTRVRGGWFGRGKKEIAVEREMFPQFRKTTVGVSALPLGFARGLQLYLDDYPHLCSEQLTSRAFPTLLLNNNDGAYLPDTEREKAVAKIIGVLRLRQNDQGAFGLWHADSDLSFDFPSVYAMHFLTEAKERGYDVPHEMFRRGLSHLESIAQDTPSGITEARQQAYAIYVLTRNQKITTNYIDRLAARLNADGDRQWRNDLAGLYVAATYAMLRNSKDAALTLSGFKLTQPPKQQQWDDFYTDLGRNAQYLYIIAKHFPDKLANISGDDLLQIVEPIARGEFVTHSAAYAILGLKAYTEVLYPPNPNAHLKDMVFPTYHVDEKLRDGTVHTLDIYGFGSGQEKFNADARTLTIRNEDPKFNVPRVFYQVTEAGFDMTPPEKPLKQGLEVHREYRDKSGKPAASVPLGEELTVSVKLRATADADISNVAILDLLPGGFEVVMDSIRATDADDEETERVSHSANTLSPDYVDIREDRVVIYGQATRTLGEYRYKIRATNRGQYKVPPIQAESLYRRELQARSQPGTLTVN